MAVAVVVAVAVAAAADLVDCRRCYDSAAVKHLVQRRETLLRDDQSRRCAATSGNASMKQNIPGQRRPP